MNIVPTNFLHLSINGRAACDARPLDPERDSSSPECRDLPCCRLCMLLQAHYARERRRR